MQVGDIVVRVNETPTSNLNHDAAHEVIVNCGNNFVMGVMRRDENDGRDSVCSETYNDLCVSPQFRQIQTPDSCTYSDMSEMTIESARTESRVSNGCARGPQQQQQHIQQLNQDLDEVDISEDQIAELISGEAEVLKEHNVIG